MLALQLAIQMLLTMSLGFIARKAKLATDDTSASLSAILLNIGIPCIILDSLNVQFNAEQFRSGIVMLFVSVAVILLLFIVGLIYRKLQRDPVLGATGHFGIMFTNYTYVGVPVMQSLYGAEGLFLYTMFTLPLRIAFYSTPPFILSSGKKEKRGAKYYLKAFYSPPLVALYAGMIIYLCRIPVPETIGNVLSNACAHAANRIGLTVDVNAAGFLVAVVEDDGSGFSAEALHHGCDAFYSEQKSAEHFGLGLNVASVLTRLHGGDIELANAPGGGARVTMTFATQRAKS